TPSTPVEISGFDDLPDVADTFQVIENEKTARNIGKNRRMAMDGQKKKSYGIVSFEQLQKEIEKGKKKQLNLIIKGDVAGSVEALADVIERMSSDDIIIDIIHKGVGSIVEGDILLARASNAAIIGFKVKPDTKARFIASRDNVKIKLYNIIYNVIEDIENLIKGMYEPEYISVKVGEAVVRSVFKIPKTGFIAGVYIKDGYIERNAIAKLIRDGDVLYEGKIITVKHFQEDRKKVDKGLECGIKIDKVDDIKTDDIVEIYIQKEK
ncbi:translation initiation factor IF-2, partial [candidate division TA06 bacterium]